MNHDDGFPSWSTGAGGVGSGGVVGIVLRGNTIINYVDPNQPYRGTLQGIGCSDLHPLPGAAAIDTGSNLGAPPA